MKSSFFRMPHQTSQRSHCWSRGERHAVQGIDNSRLSLFLHANILGLIRPNDGQGDVADGSQCRGAAVLGGKAAQENPEVRIQGHRAGNLISFD